MKQALLKESIKNKIYNSGSIATYIHIIYGRCVTVIYCIHCIERMRFCRMEWNSHATGYGTLQYQKVNEMKSAPPSFSFFDIHFIHSTQ